MSGGISLGVGISFLVVGLMFDFGLLNDGEVGRKPVGCSTGWQLYDDSFSGEPYYRGLPVVTPCSGGEAYWIADV